MTTYQINDFLAVVAAFYEVGAGQGEGVLTNPTAPKLKIIDKNGATIGVDTAMTAVAGAHAGLYKATKQLSVANGFVAGDTYSYVCYDNQDPTPTIVHAHGIFKVENNDFDGLDAEIDAIPSNVWEETTAGHANAGTMGKKLGDQTNPDNNAIADQVWDEQTSGHSAAGSTGKALTDILAGSIGTGAIADAVWDEVASGHLTAGTFGYVVSQMKGPGAGATVVTKDSGGSNNLRPTLSGVPVQGVRVEAYLTSDYAAGISYATYGKGSSVTDVNGDFTLLLGSGAYTLLYYRLRSGSTSGLTPTTTTYTVS